MAIRGVFGWEALDSRGRPTVACSVTLAGGATADALAPSGASTGSHEVHELRDGGLRYGGFGVARAVATVNEAIQEALIGADASDQEAADAILLALDGTSHLEHLGGNAVVAVSLAVARAAAAGAGEPLYRWLAVGEPLLPMPMVNVISGGLHASRLVDIQDFLVIPLAAQSFAQALEWCWRVRTATAELLAERGQPAHLVADEGGLAGSLGGNEAGVELVTRAIEACGLRPGEDAGVAIDFAATHFHGPGGYRLAAEDRELSSAEMADLVHDWCRRWPIVSIEDPLDEDDWDGWRLLTSRLGDRQVIGDDLFVTSSARIARGVDLGAANAVLVKVNQNGTVSGTARVVREAQAAGYATVVSGRSGDTEDSTLADLAVAWRGGQIKAGSTMRSERTGKWNRLLRIEAELGDSSRTFAGRSALAGEVVSP